jgi:probable HAF family extracellular repeat protein
LIAQPSGEFTLPSINDEHPVYVHGISGDGRTVVGFFGAYLSPGTATAYAWGQAGQVTFGIPNHNTEGFVSNAGASSFDGSVIVGGYTNDDGEARGFIWTDGQLIDVTDQYAQIGSISQARGVSNDGENIVGISYVGIEGDLYRRRAFIIRNSQAFTLDPATSRASSYANAVSNDGTIVAGWTSPDNSTNIDAVIWVNGELNVLPTLTGPEGDRGSIASALSADGSVIVGWARSSGSDVRAVQWSHGNITDLGTLRDDNLGASSAYDVSSDGRTIVGNAESASGYERAALWYDQNITELGSLGNYWSVARSVSDDGSVVAGEYLSDQFTRRAFIWRSNTMLDHENTLIQVSQNAAQQAAASTVLTDISEFALGQEISAPRPVDTVTRLSTKDDAHSRPPIAVRVSLAGAANSDTTDVALAGVTAAAALSPALTIGGYLGLGQEVGALEGFGIDGRFNSYGLYLRGNPSGDTGLTWKLALAQTGSDVDITRAASLANTESGAGDSHMISRAASFELGYGFQQGETTLTPFAKVTHTTYQRDGYTENNGIAFPVTYRDHKQDATFATIGLNAEFSAGERGMISLTGGLELDLNRSENPVTGTSAIPGATSFSVASPSVENSNRAFASARYTHSLNNGAAVDFSIGFKQSAYTNTPTALASVGYQMSF